MFRTRLRFLLLLALLPVVLFAQNKKLGRAPFFKTFNASKLAHALTDGLENDSLKERAIYLWMTRHIRYDVRSFSKGRQSFTAPRKILFHRKAICFGYSILYDSLCKYAGLSSEVVIGYGYEPWYAARDTFFLDNHAWNSVLINGEWTLSDVTWASGFIKPRRQVTRRVLWKLFHIPYRQKYRFKRRRNDYYFHTPPAKLIYDHLPSTPAWQLLPCSVPVDSFQYSPTATMHFLRGTPGTCADGRDSIPVIMSEPGNRRALVMGTQSVTFNPRNHQSISWGYWVYARDLFVQSENKLLSRTARIALYDSTGKQLDSAAVHFIHASADAKAARRFFLERNKRMRVQVYAENKPLIKKQEAYRKMAERERLGAKSEIKRLKRENKRIRKASRKFQKAPFRVKRPLKPKANEKQLAKLLRQAIDSNNRVIAHLADSLLPLNMQTTAGTFVQYDTTIANCGKVLRAQQGLFGGAAFLRTMYFNSYDTVMMVTKARVFLAEHLVDSMHALVPGVKSWPAAVNNRSYASTVKSMGRIMSENAKMCRQLARMSATSFNEDSAFHAQRNNYRAWNDSVISRNQQLISEYRIHAKRLKKLQKLHRRVAKASRKELRAEEFRFAATNGFFRSYYGGIAKVMKRNARECKKGKSYTARKKRKLEQEEKKKV